MIPFFEVLSALSVLSELTGQTIPVGICISLLFNQHYPARSVKLYIAGTKEMVLSEKKLLEKVYFIVKMTGPSMVQPTSSLLESALS